MYNIVNFLKVFIGVIMFLYEDENIIDIIKATQMHTKPEKLISMCQSAYSGIQSTMKKVDEIESPEERISERTKLILYTNPDLPVIRSVLQSIKDSDMVKEPEYDRDIVDVSKYWLDKSVLRTFLLIDEIYEGVTKDDPQIDLDKFAYGLRDIQLGSMRLIADLTGTNYHTLGGMIIELVTAVRVCEYERAYEKYEEINTEVLKMVYGNE